jgi:hypothetical protein
MVSYGVFDSQNSKYWTEQDMPEQDDTGQGKVVPKRDKAVIF